MDSWTRYFKVTDRCPAKLVLPGKGTVNFRSDKNDIQLLMEIFESGLPYLELTNAGKEELYDIKSKSGAKSLTKEKVLKNNQK